jgi:hypothetical protein
MKGNSPFNIMPRSKKTKCLDFYPGISSPWKQRYRACCEIPSEYYNVKSQTDKLYKIKL